jgi:hypothetical protein
MKIRMQSNSIRLRLKQREVEQFALTGRVEESVSFGERNDVFSYVLEASSSATKVRACLKARGIFVEVPEKEAANWASGNDVAIEFFQRTDGSGELQILIEKDFACLNGTDEQNADTFPNPLAGTKC